MKLLNGITGIYDSETTKPPKVDGKQFKQLCFYIASCHSGKVIDFTTPQYPANFYCTKIDIWGNQFYILLNEHYPYLAFASNVDELYGISFIDKPNLSEQFSPFYQIISSEALNTPFDQNTANHSELNRAELKELTYWKPETIGQIIFNYWD